MPRPSANDLAVPLGVSTDLRLKPPPSLSAAERAVFLDTVASTDARHFALSDMPLLTAYCEATALRQDAALGLKNGAVLDDKVSPWLKVWETAVKAQKDLSMRLRLSPQARIATRSMVKRSQPRPVSYYAMMDEIDAGRDDA